MGQEEVITEAKDDSDNFSENGSIVNQAKQNYLKNKMEEMQKRIDELKEKVKNEGDLLHNEDSTIKTNKFDSSLINLQVDVEQNDLKNENSSEPSLYFSASNYSLCSLSTSSTDSAYFNFTKFVSNFVKNQNQKERLSLLQLHSRQQISLNMMKHSLNELDCRCSEELELIERSLEHLNQLAAEFNINTQSPEVNNNKHKALEMFSTSAPVTRSHSKKNQTFIWPPLKSVPETTLHWHNNPAFISSES